MNKNIYQKTWVVICLGVFSCVLWGSASVAIKLGYKYLQVHGIPSELIFAGDRFVIAGIMVLLFKFVMDRQFPIPKKQSWKYILIFMLFQTILQYTFYYISLSLITGVKANILNACGTFFAIFFSSLLFHFEKLSLKNTIGSLVGFLGVLAVNLSTKNMFYIGLGEIAMILTGISYAIAANLMKTYGQKENSVIITGYQFLFGGIVMTILGYISGGSFYVRSIPGYALMLYLGFISAGAYSVWSVLLTHNPVSKVAIMGFLTPVLGVIFSSLFLKEALNINLLFALVLVVVGIVISNISRRS